MDLTPGSRPWLVLFPRSWIPSNMAVLLERRPYPSRQHRCGTGPQPNRVCSSRRPAPPASLAQYLASQLSSSAVPRPITGLAYRPAFVVEGNWGAAGGAGFLGCTEAPVCYVGPMQPGKLLHDIYLAVMQKRAISPGDVCSLYVRT